MDDKTLGKIARQAAEKFGLKPNLVAGYRRPEREDSDRGTMFVEFWLPNEEEVVKFEVRVDATPELIQVEIMRKLKEKLGL